MRTCVIFNPVAKGEKAKRFRRHLDDIGAECALKLTWAAGTARLLAAEAVREGFDRIVAAGGDGTVNEVLNGIGDEPDGFAKAAMGVLPLGTVNVFAKEFNLPIRLDRGWKTIRAGKETVIDLPESTILTEAGPQRRYFAQLAGAGLDARAIQLVNWEWKKKIGPLAYILAGVNAMRETHSRITVETPGHTTAAELVLIGNGKFYGGRFKVFPQADPRDGLLDVCLLPKVTWASLLRFSCALFTGRSPAGMGAELIQAKEIKLRANVPVPCELEGDTVGTLPADFRLSSSRLRLLVPLG